MPVVSTPNVERIIRAACAYFDCTEEELLLRSSETYIAYRRKLCFFLIKRQTVSVSYSRIAKRFKLADPWHISKCIAEVETQQEIYPQTARDLKAILEISNNLALAQTDSNGMDRK